MKNVIEKTWPAHTLGGQCESPEKIYFLILKWSLKLQWLCMWKGSGPSGPGKVYIKYLNIQSSKLKTVQGVHKSLIR